MKKLVIVGMLIVIIISSLTIEKNKADVSATTSPSYITYATTSKIDNLRLTNSQQRREKDILLALFEGLVMEDENGKIIPALAKEYSISEDDVEYIFKLKENIFYSNGDKITSENYKEFLLEFLKDEENIYASDLNCIFGALEYREGKAEASAVAISCPDDSTLRIRLNYPCNEFLNILASPVMGLRDYKKLDNIKSTFKGIGYTGPFIIEAINNDDIIISKNLKYYDSDEVTDEKIKFTYFNTIEEALALFEAPALSSEEQPVDMLLDVPINEISRLSKEGKIKTFQGRDMYFMVFNNKTNGDTFNVDIRNLIEKSISKEKYISEISKEILCIANSYEINDGTKEVFSPNVQSKGEDALEEEKEGLKDSTITIIYEKNSLNAQLSRSIGEDIKKAFQVETRLIECTREELERSLKEEEYDIALLNFQRRYNYLGEYLESLSENSSLNYTKYQNAQFNKLLNQARYEGNEEKRKIIYDECENILREDLISIPLFSVNYPLCMKEELQGVKVTTTGNIKLNNLKIND